MTWLRVDARPRAAFVVVLVLLLSAAAALAQRRFFYYGWDESVRNVPYDGRFTFVRVRYAPAPGGTELTHSTRIVLIDTQQQVRAYLEGHDATPDDVVNAAKRLIK